MIIGVDHRLTTVALLLLAVNSHAQTVTCPQPLPEVCALAKQRLQNLTSNKPETCKLDANAGGSGNCPTFTITVHPATAPDKACVAVVPYSSLAVTGAKLNKRLSWALDTQAAQAGYKFKSADGMGMTLVPPSSPASAPKLVWHESKTKDRGKTVELKVKKQELTAWCHYPQVVDASNKPCCPLDPVISNDPN